MIRLGGLQSDGVWCSMTISTRGRGLGNLGALMGAPFTYGEFHTTMALPRAFKEKPGRLTPPTEVGRPLILPCEP